MARENEIMAEDRIPDDLRSAAAEMGLSGYVDDDVHQELARHFSDQERVELMVTAGFHAMVPRVLDALRVAMEEDPRSWPTA